MFWFKQKRGLLRLQLKITFEHWSSRCIFWACRQRKGKVTLHCTVVKSFRQQYLLSPFSTCADYLQIVFSPFLVFLPFYTYISICTGIHMSHPENLTTKFMVPSPDSKDNNWAKYLYYTTSVPSRIACTMQHHCASAAFRFKTFQTFIVLRIRFLK